MTRDERRIRTALLTYAADRQRLELVIPAHMLWYCCQSIGDVPASTPTDRAWWGQVMPLLQTACLEPLAGLPEPRWQTATELSKLITKTAMAELYRRPVMTATMAVLRWLEAMLAHDVLDLVEGTAIDQALTIVMTTVGEHSDMASDVDRSARKVAKGMHARLQCLGLYKGAEIW